MPTEGGTKKTGENVFGSGILIRVQTHDAYVFFSVVVAVVICAVQIVADGTG